MDRALRGNAAASYLPRTRKRCATSRLVLYPHRSQDLDHVWMNRKVEPHGRSERERTRTSLAPRLRESDDQGGRCLGRPADFGEVHDGKRAH